MVVPGLAHTSVEVPERSVRALFEASGVIRVDTLGDLFDVALLLSSQPLPAGARVAVVGNSTALGVLVDQRPRRGGSAARPARRHRRRRGVRGVRVRAARRRWTTRASTPWSSSSCRRCSAASSEEVAAALRTVARASEQAGAVDVPGLRGRAGRAGRGRRHLARARARCRPTRRPERAVRALGRAVRYAAWRRRAPGVVPQLDGVDARRRARSRPRAVDGDPGRARADLGGGAGAARRAPASPLAHEAEPGRRRRAHRARRQVVRRARLVRRARRGHRAAGRPGLRRRPAHHRRRRRS